MKGWVKGGLKAGSGDDETKGWWMIVIGVVVW